MLNILHPNDSHLKYWIENKCSYPDFPIPGINFIDIFSVIRGFGLGPIRDLDIKADIVLVPEALGFIFMESLCEERCVPLRKMGKLPGDTLAFSYKCEYAEGVMQVSLNHLDSIVQDILDQDDLPPDFVSVAIFDDVLATGGTAQSIINAIDGVNIKGLPLKVVSANFYLALTDLEGWNNISVPCRCCFNYGNKEIH